MSDFFSTFVGLIVFLHIFFAMIWIGGMIAIRFVVHYAIAEIKDDEIKLGRTLEILRRFFNIIIPSIIVLLLTAIIMSIGFGFKGTELSQIAHIKEAIWSLMTVVFIIIYLKRNKAQRLFDERDIKGAKITLLPVARWMIPLNIFLGIVALYLGVTLRGF